MGILESMRKMYYFQWLIRSLYSPSRFHKLLFLLALSVLVTLYLFWSSVPDFFEEKYVKTSKLDVCMKDRVHPFDQKLASHDAVLYHKNLKSGEKYYFPFVGNGYFGCSWHGDGKLMIKNKRSLSDTIEYYPLIRFHLPNFQTEEAYVLDFLDGIIYKLQCMKQTSLCISVGTMLYAHRLQSDLLFQNIRVYNPTNLDTTMHLVREKSSDWKDFETLQLQVKLSADGIAKNKETSMNYLLFSGIVPISSTSGQELYKFMTIAEPDYPKIITIPAGETMTFRYMTVIRYSESMTLDQMQQSKSTLKSELKDAVMSKLKSVITIQELELRNIHTSAWHELWSSGMYISPSLAPNSLNGDQINDTLYNLISHSPSLIHASSNVSTYRESFYSTYHCYNDHSTLQASRLWTKVKTERQLSHLVDFWLITLEKQGCSRIIESGADGVLQAALMSMGALHFADGHLEFGMHPEDLHRDFVFRGIYYSAGTRVTIAVELDEGNKALLYVSAESNQTLYACDAGCQDQPIQLKSKTSNRLPTKITEPLTPILYIANNRRHLDELHRAIHVKSIREAPAHGHQIVAIHRHGHALGGLPFMFWLSVGLLIGLFHAFLIKLIIAEYCKYESMNPRQSRNYSNTRNS